MIEELIKTLPQLSVGAVSILAVIVIAYLFLKYTKETSDSHQVSMKERDDKFFDFVQSNNHKVTDLVVSATEQMKESTKAIQESSKFIQEATGTMKEVRDHLIRENSKK